MQNWIVTAVAAGLVLVLAVALLRLRSRTERTLAAAHAEMAALRTELEELERRLDRPPASARATEPEFVITDVGDRGVVPSEPPRIESALFADLVLRETVVKAASLAHGVRRALGPEPRNRIRFEMRQELRSARKRRLRLRKELLRQARAADRGGLDEGSAA